MRRIGLLSDTHGFLHEKVFDFFNDVDEVWHAGDFGSIEVIQRLSAFRNLKGVYGNIDGADVRSIFSMHERFFCEQVDVWITHIGGYPSNYDPRIRKDIVFNPPKLFISGHSHILKVIYDKKLSLLHVNPGAAGYAGFHKVLTAVRFVIDGENIKDLEVWEMPRSRLA